MPDDLKTIVQRMVDAGEPEENIASVIRAYPTVAKQPAADNRSVFSRAYDAVFTAPEIVTETAARGADVVDPRMDPNFKASGRSYGFIPEETIRAFGAGALEGAASLLTPGDVTLTALGWGPLARGVRALRGGARAVEVANTAANLAGAARGVERAANAEDWTETAAGVAQTALGIAGAKSPPRPGGPEVLPPEVVPEPKRLPAPKIYVDQAGRANVGEMPTIDLSPVPRPKGPDPSGARAARAPATEWAIDPTVKADEGVRPRVYSGDPNQPDAPFVSPEERRALELFRQELEEFPADMGAQIRDPNDPSSTIYTPGTPASRAHHAIARTSNQHESNGQMIEAIDSLLDGNPPTNRIQTAALDLARAHVEQRPGALKPMFEGLEGVEPMQRRAAAEEAERAADPEWAEFSDLVDDMAWKTRPAEVAGIGERGFSTTPFMLHTAGGLAGAAYGGATGEDMEDRIKRGLIYGAAGAGAPALFRRGGGSAAARAADRLGSAGKVTADDDVLFTGRQPRVPRTARMGNEIADPMAETDRFLGKFHPDVQQGIKQRLEANEGFADQRRGTIPVEQIGRVAQEIKVNLTNVLPKGTAPQAEVVTAYARAAQKTQQKVAELADRVAKGANTDADLLNLERARADAEVVLKSLMGLRSEAGRSLATFRYLDTLLASGNVTLTHDVAEGLRRQAQEFAKRFAKVSADVKGDPVARYRWLQGEMKPTKAEMLRQYMYANMLSGPKTHERNIIGNVSNLVGRTATHPFAVGLDVAKSAISGKPREVFMGEVGAGVKHAASRFLEDSWKDASFAMREGINPMALKKSLAAAEKGVLDVPRIEFPGGLKNPLNIPGRALDATDVLFRSIARNMEIGGGAHAIGRSEGLSGLGLEARERQLRAGKGDVAERLHETSEKQAARSVFQEEPWDAVKWAAQGYRQKGWGAIQTVMMPFLKTPANILKQGLETSPLGFGMAAAKQAGREGTRAQGAAAAGTLAAAYLAYLAATDRLSGMGPTDPQERATLMETGWRPNSVKIGDQWVNYQAIAPVGVQASIIANLVEARKAGKISEKDYADQVAETMGRFGNSFLDQSFLSGTSELLEAIKDPDRSMGRWASRTAQTMIPLVGLVRSARDVADPTIRKPKGVVEEAQAAIPFMSQSIEPRLSTTGEPVTREGGPVRRALDPFNTAGVIHDPTAEELKRLKITATRLGNTLALPEGVELSREELFALRQQQGRYERAAIEKLMDDPRYKAASDAQKIKAIEKTQRKARERVNDATRARLIRAAREK